MSESFNCALIILGSGKGLSPLTTFAMKYLIIVLSCLPMITLMAQKEDYIWLMGRGSNTIDSSYGGTVIDFNSQPPEFYYQFREMNLSQTNASICDTNGNLLFYTNGIYIANFLHEEMENSESLNPSELTNDNYGIGLPLWQGALILPNPENHHKYYLLHEPVEYGSTLDIPYYSDKWYYTLIDMAENNGAGRVLEKNIPIIEDTLDLGKITAVKNGNGRDWWVLSPGFNDASYNEVLLTPEGLSPATVQEVGTSIPYGVGQSVFSPDGKIYVRYNLISFSHGGHLLNIYDFDRCEGLLSNHRQIPIPDSAFAGGVAISPNSRFLYVSSYKYIYQYDLHAESIEQSKDTIVIYDGFLAPFATRFFSPNLLLMEKYI